MATPNDLYGWFPSMNQPLPDPARWQIPERAPGNLAPIPQGISPNFSGGPFTEQAFNLAGRPSMKPPAGVTMPGVPIAGGDEAVSGGGGGLGNLNSLNSLYKNGNKLYDMLGGGASAAPAGAAQPIDLGTIGSAGLGSIGAGAMFGSSGASALGAAAPVATDTALANLGTVSAGDLFGTSASVAAGPGPGSLGTTGGTGSLASGSTGAGGTLAGSGLTQAIPIAAIAWMAADALNKKGDIKSGATTAMIDGLADQFGWKGVPGRVPTWKLPDGRIVRAGEKARTASEAWRQGDQAGFEKAYNDWISDAFTPGGERSFKDWAQGH